MKWRSVYFRLQNNGIYRRKKNGSACPQKPGSSHRFGYDKERHALTWVAGKARISDIDEPVSKCSILCEIKEGKKINHRNTLSLLRIKALFKIRLPDAEIGQKGAF